MAERCGSFPLMNLAEDFGVDYGDVLVLFDAGVQMARGVRVEDVPAGRVFAVIEAVARLQVALGRRDARFGEIMEPLVGARTRI